MFEFSNPNRMVLNFFGKGTYILRKKVKISSFKDLQIVSFADSTQNVLTRGPIYSLFLPNKKWPKYLTIRLRTSTSKNSKHHEI